MMADDESHKNNVDFMRATNKTVMHDNWPNPTHLGGDFSVCKCMYMRVLLSTRKRKPKSQFAIRDGEIQKQLISIAFMCQK